MTTVASAAPTAAANGVRVYVGGLPPDASGAELQERFSRALAGVAGGCHVQRVQLPPPKGVLAPAPRGFAYLALEGDGAAAGAQLLERTFHRTKWRGAVLRVEPARLDFPAQLRAEWDAQRAAAAAAAQARALALAPPPSAWATDAQLHDLRVGGVAYCGRRRTSFEAGEWLADPLPVVAAPSRETSDGGGAEDDEGDDDDDADYWATSGDDADSDDTDGGDSAGPPLAEDDVEAFVVQAMAQQAASSDESESEQESERESESDGDAVDEGDVEAFVAQAQREEANARRVAALAAKQQLKQQQLKQQSAVKIDLSAMSRTKITFDDSGNEQEASDGEGGGGGGGGGGAAAITNWLDSSDDEGDGDGGSKPTDYGELRDGSDGEASEPTARRRPHGALEFGGGDDDGGGGSDSDAGKTFAVRPEFLGERGRRLFELQKRFGGDQRFRMDARFIDDEENEYGGMNDLVDDVADDNGDDAAALGVADGPVGELQAFLQEDGAAAAAAQERAWLAEQDAALSAIAAIFPDVDVESIKYRVRVKATKDPVKEAAWMGRLQRYDPRDAHARLAYELPMTTERAKHRADSADAELDAVAATTKPRDEKEVLIGGDRFFSTSTSLGSLFTRVRKNSEDGVEGEAALDGVFGSVRGPDADADAGDAATFKLSSLFDAPVEDERATNSRLAAMGATLFDDDDDDKDDKDDDGDKPWHFTQSFMNDEKDGDVRMDTDNEDDGDDSGGDGDADDGDSAGGDTTGDMTKRQKAAPKKSLTEFLAFGRMFVASPPDGSKPPSGKDWAETRKRLTLDFKRKRKDALRNKKKLLQRLQKQHKKHKTAR